VLLSKQQILGMDDLPHEDIEVPEWGGTVRVRVMTGVERDAWETSIYQNKGDDVQVNQENFRASLVARCLSDESGAILFSTEEIKQLGTKSSIALDRIFTVARRLNAISKADKDELTKN